jgi:hypothetical protein
VTTGIHSNNASMTDIEIHWTFAPALLSLYVYIALDGANFGSYLAIEDSRQIPNMDTERYAKVIYKV